MKKYLVILGLTAMMLFGVGCNKTESVEAEEVEVTTTIYDEAVDGVNELTEDLIDLSIDYYVGAIEEIYGLNAEDFDESKIVTDEFGMTYEGKTVSWAYIDEVAANSMYNDWYGTN